MTNSIGDLLNMDRFQQPPEVAIIKDYVQTKFQVTPSVTVNDQQIIITVSSSGLAGALRPYIWELTQLCQTRKRMLIRIQ